MKKDRPFCEGDPVIVLIGHYQKRATEHTVEKVYANGNFRLTDSREQWRQSGVRAGGRHATWNSRCYHADDPQALATLANTRHTEALARIEALLSRLRSNFTPPHGKTLGQVNESTEKLNEALAALRGFYEP